MVLCEDEGSFRSSKTKAAKAAFLLGETSGSAMSVKAQKQTSNSRPVMSALPPKADIKRLAAISPAFCCLLLPETNKKKFPEPAGNAKLAYETPAAPYGDIENAKK
jgi:hypothetical protein